MKKTKKLIIATYNIQFSQHPKEIEKNILTMVSMGTSVFCLQEVVFDSDKTFIIGVLLKKLGNNWKAIYNLGNKKSILGMGNCIIWNTKILNLEKEQKEFLPKCKSLKINERIFSLIVAGITAPFQRRVIIGYFKFNNVIIRISNIHLDHNGGLENRKKQLLYLINILKKNKSINHEIICGDFNSLDLLNNGKEIIMQRKILGDYFIDVSKDSGWTADLYNIDIINSGMKLIKLLIKYLHLHIRRKLDYIWVKNITSFGCKKLILKGSDHNPLIAYLDI